METRRALRLTAAACAAALLLPGCRRDGAAPMGLIKIDGSSTVYPIVEAMAEEFQLAHRGARVTVGISGTGGGFKKLCAGEVDVANASRPIKPIEVEACRKRGVEYVELPVAFDGIAIVVNPKNDWLTSITTAELKKIWEPAAQGKVKRWRDVRPEWPDEELRLFGAGVDSGTYDYFTEAINQEEHASRGDYTSSEDDNVLVQGIANDRYALGFFGLAYYEENKEQLKLVPVDDGKPENGDGPVPASAETVSSGKYQPLSRPLFVYVSTAALARPEIQRFTRFFTANAAELVPAVGFIPLPPRAYVLAGERLDRRRTGSLFAGKGSQVGVSIEQLLSVEGGPDGGGA